MCLIHKWGKWEQYESREPARRLTEKWMLSAIKEYRQRKICQKCGVVKDKLIYTKVLG